MLPALAMSTSDGYGEIGYIHDNDNALAWILPGLRVVRWMI